MAEDRTNGFRIRGLNPDAQKVAVCSNVDTTWMLPYKRLGILPPAWTDVALGKNEVKVLRTRGDETAEPVIEVEPLGGPYGVLIVDRSRRGTRTLRVGQRHRMELARGESVVLKTEFLVHPSGEKDRHE